MTEPQKKEVEAAMATPSSRERIAPLDGHVHVHSMVKIGLKQLAKRDGHENLPAFLRKLANSSVLAFWDENPEQADAALKVFNALRSTQSKEVKKVSYTQIKEIRSDPCVAEKLGLYIAQIDQDSWAALDNLKGDAFFEKFRSEGDAIFWLKNPDEWEEPGRFVM